MTTFTAHWASGRLAKWRSLSWAEYKRFSKRLESENPMEVYCDLYRTVVIYGPPLEGDPLVVAPAGLVQWIARAMLEANPFNGRYETIKGALDLKRRELNADYLSTVKAIIAGIFRYTFEEIDSWDAETFFERVAAAEFVSGRKIEPGDPKKKRRQPRPSTPVSDMPAPAQRFVDPRMPAPSEETVNDGEGPPHVTQKALTPAQQMVIDRRTKQSR